MKIRTRFTLAFLGIVLVTVSLLSYYVNTILTARVTEEKTHGYRVYLEQLSNTVGLIADESEQAFFNQYNNLNLASVILSGQTQLNKTLSVENSMVSIPLNVSNMHSVLILDDRQERYFATRKLAERPEVFEDILKDGIMDSAFTVWARDGQGEIFLKKELYRASPMSRAGIIVAHMDKNALLRSIHMDSEPEGMIAIVTGQSRILLSSDRMDEELCGHILETVGKIWSSKEGRITANERDYWYTVSPSADYQWLTLQAVPMNTMLAMPLALGRIIWFGAAGILAVAVLISILITRPMARNVRGLLSSIDEVSRGHFETPIMVKGRDEIGQLADKFRWMQGKLKTVTEEQVKHATEKQQADYEMLELKYRSLQAQISPHFICNVLSTIDALTQMNRPTEVSRLSIKAAGYLRDNLRSSDAKFHALEDELRFVIEYAEVYRDLYQNGFELDVDAADELMVCRVPTMLLQPLVENALVHGMPPDDPDRINHIAVNVGREGENLILTVRNDGEAISSEVIDMVERAESDSEFNRKMKGFGLRGVIQRLRLLYGERQSLRIVTDEEKDTIIVIRIPCETMEEYREE